MARSLAVYLALGAGASGCAEVPTPAGDLLIADHNWQPPPPDKLRCRRGPIIRVMVETRAFVQDSGGYLDCVHTYPEATETAGNESQVLLTLEASPGHLTLSTASSSSVYYFLVARTAADTLAWAPCVDPKRCRHVRRGAPVRIPYDRIAGWVRGEPQVVLYAWRLTPGAQGGYRPDRIRAVAIEVQSWDPRNPKR